MEARIGIDVGGTFTKAVLVDNATGSLLAKATVPTTHHAAEGVAAGVVEAFRQVLDRAGVPTSSVDLVVLSTTQAVNALLEADVAPVGVIGLSSPAEQKDALKRTRLGRVRLTPTRDLPVFHTFLTSDHLSDSQICEAITHLLDQGARAIVASAAYSVEDPYLEQRVVEVASRMGVPVTAGHQMSGLYGLEIRTLTAAVNASIMPHMQGTADWVEASMRRAGLHAPLMVMHGDLQVASIDQVRSRPATTILSGPAASVAGALMYHKVVDGLFMEVGGTSTNIGVVRNGRPVMKYVRIMDHPTCLRSVDVRVAGVAGGSMLRLRAGKLVDVGPRSAHIAGLPYASFTAPEKLRGARLVTLAPIADDPADYVVLENPEGERFAVTVTDAANALGVLPEGDYARGSQESARLAMESLASHLGISANQAAERVLDMASEKIIPVLKDLMKEHRLGKVPVVGLGGGASVLVPWTARRLALSHQLVPNAEVISSIGVAMAPVGVELERSLPCTDPELLVRMIKEAEQAAVRAGADPAAVLVTVEPVPERSAVRLRAAGAHSGQVTGQWWEVSSDSARALAAGVLRVAPEELSLVFENRFYRVFSAEKLTGIWPFKHRKSLVAAIDREGVVRFVAEDGVWVCSRADDIRNRLEQLIRPRQGLLGDSPRIALVYGPHLVDLPTGFETSLEQVARQLDGEPTGEPMLVLAGSAVSGR